MDNSLQPDTQPTGISVAVFRIFKSLARFALRRGMSIAAASEILRRAYVAAAADLIKEENNRVTASRICAMTGLYRREVRRLQTLPAIQNQNTHDKLNRSARVISGWLRDPDFNTSTGRPAVLKPEGDYGFDQLIRRYCPDITPTAIRQELERLELIGITRGGSIKLQTSAYLHTTDEEGMFYLGRDVSDLVNTIAHNLDNDSDNRLFQRKVSYINVPSRYREAFKLLIEQECQQVLTNLDAWLSKLSARPDDTEKFRLGVGVYHFQAAQSETGEDNPVTGPESLCEKRQSEQVE